MKKIYESPNSVLMAINSADVLTASNELFYNFTQNADLDVNDSISFESFFN